MARVKLLVALLLVSALPLFAESPRYDAAKEVTLRGEILYAADSAAGAGMYVIMKDGNNEIEVHLAPSSFLATAGIELKVGSTIKVSGSRTTWKGSDIILARELTAGSKTVTLRNANGQPRW